MRTLVGTPDPNRRARLEWVAQTLRLLPARMRQAMRKVGK